MGDQIRLEMQAVSNSVVDSAIDKSLGSDAAEVKKPQQLL
jgi:hypothetical protein